MATLPLDYVAFWKMSNKTGTTLNDESGSYSGVIADASTIDGRFGDALFFDVNNLGNVNFGDILDIGVSSWTYSFWFTINSTSAADQAMLTKAIAASASTYRFQISVNNQNQPFAWLSSTGTTFSATSPTALQNGTRYHCAVRMDRSGEMQVWINNKKLAVVDISSIEAFDNSNNYPFRLGAYTASDNSTPVSSFDGALEYVRVYNRALSDNELKALYREAIPYPKDYDVFYDMTLSEAGLLDVTGDYIANVYGATPDSSLYAFNYLSFDGSSYVESQLNYPLSPSLFAIAGFFMVTGGQGTSRNIIHVGDSSDGGDQGIGISIDANDNLAISYLVNSPTSWGAFSISSESIELNRWYFFCLSRENGDYQLTLNAVTETQTVGDMRYGGGQTIKLGTYKQTQNSNYFIGGIAKIMLFPRALNPAEVQVLYTKYSMMLGLVAHYKMSKFNGSILIDETGDYDATFSGATQAVGQIDKALSFDGINDYATLPLSQMPTFNKIAFSFWAYRVSDGEDSCLFCTPTNPSEDRINLHFPFSDGNWYWDFKSATSNRISGAWNSAWYSNWVHFIAQYDGTSLELYADTELVASGGGPGYSYTPSLEDLNLCLNIGASPDAYTSVILEQFRIYDRALDSAEIEALYFESLSTLYFQGTITESLAVTEFKIRAYDMQTGAMSGETVSTNGTYEIEVSADNNGDHYLTAIPYQGERWVAGSSVALDALVIPNDTITTPYYFKVTTSGTTGQVEPNWVTTPGQTVNDNGVILECVERLIRPLTHGPVSPS